MLRPVSAALYAPAQQRSSRPGTIGRAAWQLLRERWLGADATGDPDASIASRLDAIEAAGATGAADDRSEVGDSIVWFDTADDAGAGRRDVLRLGVRSAATADSPAGADWVADFDLERIEEEDVRALLAALDHVADTMASAPEACWRHVDPLDPASRAFLGKWSAEPAVSPPASTVHAAFRLRAAARGDAPAVIAADGVLDYAALDRGSDALAARLERAGVRPGETVGIALGRGRESIVALLAVLKCGAAYLPIDAAHPRERIAFMLDDASVRQAVSMAALRDRLPAGTQTILVDDEPEDGAGPAIPHDDDGDRDALAYVMYTSGSTGTPKGIEIGHRAILRLVVGACYVDLSERTRMLHAAPLGFDASTLEIWGPLLNGGVCVLHDEELPTPAGLAATIRRHGVDTAWLTAALFNAVVDDDPAHLGGLRQLLIGGEALSVPHVRKALAALPAVQIVNGYGPTECTTFAATCRIPRDLAAAARSVPIGRPINDTSLHVLSPAMQPLAPGLVGELYVGGGGLARGYLRRPDLTRERFVRDAAASLAAAGSRLYRTGDLVRWLASGDLEFIARADAQVKVRGFRIEPGEIEAAIALHAGVRASAVIAKRDSAGNARLVAYVVPTDVDGINVQALRRDLAERLPAHMLPAAFVLLSALPITANGKLDRLVLPEPPSERPPLDRPYEPPADELEHRVAAVFAEVLAIDGVGRHDGFFALGGNSLLVLRALTKLRESGAGNLGTAAFFTEPTPAGIARRLSGGASARDDRRRRTRPAAAASSAVEPIAIVAVAGRFPGAADVDAFWANLCAGRDGITDFAAEDLDPSLPAALVGDPDYVKSRGVLQGVELFDAAFFGFTPREADLTDPQQRVFLELCWECLERGGIAPDATRVPVGVFGGMDNARYFQRHLQTRPELVAAAGEFAVMLANEKDYLTSRVAHRLDLTGPAISVNTACSTSLVAIAQAIASLRAGQCDAALAGGVAISCPPRSGYLYQEGAMLSPDGRTRSFDAAAQGTSFNDGAAVVLLKRLADALADGDTIHALIRGIAVNNDGRDKASFTAPSAEGQAAVIAAAHAAAGVDARSISYIEAHGTATPLGDPIEIAGLTQAFRRTTADVGFCRIGSVKSNVGHLVIASGVAGVIKTALALEREEIPATIHFDRANPNLGLDGSPFVVNDVRAAWPRGGTPRRAGVSSFGVGGTNAHAVLEEAPVRPPSAPSRGLQTLMLSAKTATALAAIAERLAEHLEARPEIELADVAHTLQLGRSRFAHRLAAVAATAEAAVRALRSPADAMRATGSVEAPRPMVWLFPGQGSQYAGMGRALQAHDVAFREAFDACIAAFPPELRDTLAGTMFDGDPDALRPTAINQPATFCIEYALASAWLARGARPAALVGHSVGEFAAAVIAGVMSLADAARLVAFRGAAMQALPAGAMAAVRLPLDALAARLPEALSLAAENAPNACVVSGPVDAVERFVSALEADGVAARRLDTSHAFHSSMMDPAVEPFEAEVRRIALAPPRIPIASTSTGRWLADAEATDPRYWARHLREPVRFSAALRTVLERHDAVFLELGPRASLSAAVRQHATAGRPAPITVPSLGGELEAEAASFALARARLWTLGLELPAAPAASPAEGRRRIPLPTYPFERRRHWIDAAPPLVAPQAASETISAPEPAMSSSAVSNDAASSVPPSRRPQLVARLRTAFEDVAGTDLSEVHPSASFVEIGLDSLTLTQAALQVKKEFRVALSFRQLMEKYRSFDALAEFLDAQLPAEPVAAATPASAVATAAPNVPAVAAPTQPAASVAQAAPAAPPLFVTPAGVTGPAGGFVQQLIQQQMQLMAQQLALLGGGAAAPAVSATNASPDNAAAATSNAAPAPGLAASAASNAPAPAAIPATAAAAQGRTSAATLQAPADAPPGEEAGAIRYDVKKAFGAIARIHTQASELSERQRARLDAFMRRYIERTRKSRDYTVRHRPRMADPRVVNGFRPMTKEITYQIVVERSKGSRVWDLDGNEYVDTLNGFGMNLFGWQPDFVVDALKAQIELGYEIGPQHPLAGEVCELICELTGSERAALCNTGSEAVMAAVRIARTVTGRSTVVLFTGSYHGTFDEVLVRAGRGAKGIPAAPGIMSGVFGDVRVLDYGTPEALEFIRANADDLAAVVVEPVQSRRPEFRPAEFLKELRAITEKSGTCFVFDEVITGFRSQLDGAQGHFGIRADLASYGKVIGGGLPVGVVAGKRDYMDALDGGAWDYGDDSMPTVGVTYFAGTFVRHPLALAAAKASLLHLKREGPALQTGLNDRIGAMAGELTAFCREVGAPVEVRHFASLWRVAWLEDHPLQDLLFAMMRSRGVHILDNFPNFMTTAHSAADLRIVIDAFKASIRELQEADFLPHRPAVSLVFDASKPPVPGARLGKDPDGKPAWFVRHPDDPAKYVKVSA